MPARGSLAAGTCTASHGVGHLEAVAAPRSRTSATRRVGRFEGQAAPGGSRTSLEKEGEQGGRVEEAATFFGRCARGGAAGHQVPRPIKRIKRGETEDVVQYRYSGISVETVARSIGEEEGSPGHALEISSSPHRVALQFDTSAVQHGPLGKLKVCADPFGVVLACAVYRCGHSHDRLGGKRKREVVVKTQNHTRVLVRESAPKTPRRCC